MNYLQSLHYALEAVQSKVRPNDALNSEPSRLKNEIEGALAFAVIAEIKRSQPFAPNRSLTADEVDTMVSDAYANLPKFNC